MCNYDWINDAPTPSAPWTDDPAIYATFWLTYERDLGLSEYFRDRNPAAINDEVILGIAEEWVAEGLPEAFAFDHCDESCECCEGAIEGRAALLDVETTIAWLRSKLPTYLEVE